jgi:hypothetical protein
MRYKTTLRSSFQRSAPLCIPVLLLYAMAVVAQSNPALTPAEQKIQLLRERLSSSDMELRRDAVMQLGAMHISDASRAALPALSDISPAVRATAAKAVLSLNPDEAVDALTKLLTDKDEFVRREATYALGLTGSSKATSPVSSMLQNDKKDSVRAAAAVALGELRDETAVPLLVSVLAPNLTQTGEGKGRREGNEFVLRAAATSLGLIKSRTATPALISALSNKEYPDDVKREAALSLGLIGDPAAEGALRIAANSLDPYLAAIAQQSLLRVSR